MKSVKKIFPNYYVLVETQWNFKLYLGKYLLSKHPSYLKLIKIIQNK